LAGLLVGDERTASGACLAVWIDLLLSLLLPITLGALCPLACGG
jgi:hypothetical protein